MQQRGYEIYSAQLVLVDLCLNRWEQSVSWPGVISGGTSFRGIGYMLRNNSGVFWPKCGKEQWASFTNLFVSYVPDL